jgi:hypothetical protein
MNLGLENKPDLDHSAGSVVGRTFDMGKGCGLDLSI